MSKVVFSIVTVGGFTLDITRQSPGYGDAWGWSEGAGPGMAGCTGFDTPGEALDHGLEALGVVADAAGVIA